MNRFGEVLVGAVGVAAAAVLARRLRQRGVHRAEHSVRLAAGGRHFQRLLGGRHRILHFVLAQVHARELGREGPRQRHRGHRLPGPRVGDRLANPVLRYSHRLHQLNLTALLRGRLKLRLPAAPLLAHFRISCCAKIKFCRVGYCLIELQWADAYAMKRCRRADRVDVRWLARRTEIESSAEDELGQMYS